MSSISIIGAGTMARILGTRALAGALPDATYRTLPGQNHMVKAHAIAPVLTEFFTTRD